MALGLAWLPEHGKGVDRGTGAALRAGGHPCSRVLQLAPQMHAAARRFRDC